MNVDEKPELVKPFLEKNQYTFPTLLAHSYARGTLQTKGIPRNLILDRGGVFQFDKVGFVPGSAWLETLSENIEKVRRAPDRGSSNPVGKPTGG